MQAIKKIIKAKNNKITLNIPDEFIDKNIEVILIQSEENKIENKKEYINLLKNGPKLSEEEIEDIEEVGKRINELKQNQLRIMD